MTATMKFRTDSTTDRALARVAAAENAGAVAAAIGAVTVALAARSLTRDAQRTVRRIRRGRVIIPATAGTVTTAAVAGRCGKLPGDVNSATAKISITQVAVNAVAGLASGAVAARVIGSRPRLPVREAVAVAAMLHGPSVVRQISDERRKALGARSS